MNRHGVSRDLSRSGTIRTEESVRFVSNGASTDTTT
jgi:hypothetical protein